MTYIFFEFENEKFWIEVDKNGYAQRQIICKKGIYSLSCRTDCLAEGIVDIENDCTQISSELFNEVWEKNASEIRAVWNIEKEKYPIGSLVKGTIRYFYPQGIIFDLDNLQGCANFDCCKKMSKPSSLYPSRLISGRVCGYDEYNMWILLDKCKAE